MPKWNPLQATPCQYTISTAMKLIMDLYSRLNIILSKRMCNGTDRGLKQISSMASLVILCQKKWSPRMFKKEIKHILRSVRTRQLSSYSSVSYVNWCCVIPRLVACDVYLCFADRLHYLWNVPSPKMGMLCLKFFVKAIRTKSILHSNLWQQDSIMPSILVVQT